MRNTYPSASDLPVPIGVNVLQIPFHQAFQGFQNNGVSEQKFRVLMNKAGVEIPHNEYPDIFYTLDELQQQEIGEASVFVQLGTSDGLGLSREEALSAFKRKRGAENITILGPDGNMALAGRIIQ